jgi:hypothetical protein
MTTTTQNIEHWAGNWRLLHFGPVVDVLGNFVDLNAPTAIRWWLGKKATSTGTDIFVKKALGSGITLTNSSGQWTIHVQLDSDDTENIPAGSFYYELEIIDHQGNVSTAFIGKFKLNAVIIPADLDVP